MSSLNTAIIGGGVAGLGLARGLAHRGMPVTLFERSEAYGERGFGFILLANGWLALRGLGIEFDPRELGQSLERAVIRAVDGTILKDETLDGAVAVSRFDLLSAIMHGLPNGAIELGRDFTGFEWDGNRALAARFDDGSTFEASAFVGSDGVRSRCRECVAPSHAWQAGRVKEIVSSVQAPALAAELGTTFRKVMHPGGGLAVGLVPAGRGRVIWFVQFDAQRFQPPALGQAMDFFAEHLAGFPADVRAAIAATDPATPHVWHTVDMDPPPSMVRGNVALIGDAAHPLLPFTSQGANSALEDAVLLADLIARCRSQGDVALAMRSFNAVRHPLMVQYVEGGRAIARQFVEPIDGAVPLPLLT